ncbi:MAG: hypothetical protein ACXQS5_01165 [Candidatus Methanospirareceae archaeon]
MEEKKIREVMKILNAWNPLGERASTIQDLEGYRTEAIDILFHVNSKSSESHIQKVVLKVLNEAFDLSLSRDECIDPAKRIFDLLKDELE